MNRTLNTEDNNVTYDILMVYGAICKDIDINRRLRGFHFTESCIHFIIEFRDFVVGHTKATWSS
jgi:hypothetical protein